MTIARIAAVVAGLSLSAAALPTQAQTLAQTLAQTPAPAHGPLAADAATWNRAVSRDAAWFAAPEARRMADSVLQYQSPEGAWPKNTDMTNPPTGPISPELTNGFDNDATTLPIEFLAKIITAGGDDPAYRAAFDRGLAYVLSAQYPNGGWPQFFPLREGYYSHITFNDDAMVRILTLLTGVASGEPPYAFVPAGERQKAAAAVTRGIDIILKTQVRQDGKLTVWCAQHDETTLEPAWARRFEPPSLSGYESVGLARYLMSLDDPSPEVIAAVDGAVAWFQANSIPDIRIEAFTNDAGERDRRVVAAPGAPLQWARFYDLTTHKPVFMGRESIARESLAEIERERRAGYNYYTPAPARLIAEDYPAWRRRIGRTDG
jgi:PelA/Pel-15E family pectate lyase